uniref:NADH dehydrogenase subunit 3 n=1 Tax=Dermatobranchus otome TaxID=1504997 RepID=UPI001FF27E59|nr:NADH dehydrogenase subunit 3 [Dermatobranchus otome]UOD76590.1 NADH dehydrogenase subunit 3 [Dermatobranchus otome]UOD76603.1 NADH dehydrogenase subunit 3 [Dermatobranchus otome]
MFALSLSFAGLLSGALIIVYAATSYITHSDLGEKMTPFECGFDPLSKMRSPFSTRFFLLVVLFLIFDVEIALLFPVLSSLSTGTSTMLLGSLALFLIILLVGMFHEWNEGALDWVSS